MNSLIRTPKLLWHTSRAARCSQVRLLHNVRTHPKIDPALERDDVLQDVCRSLVQSNIQAGLLQDCWRWYRRYLDNSIKGDWEHVLQKAILGLDPVCPKEAIAWSQQVRNVYDVVKVVMDAVTVRGDVSIDDIVLELLSKQTLRTEEKDSPRLASGDHNEARQLVWFLLGKVTMLYDPKPQLHQHRLNLRLPSSGLRSSGHIRPGEISCGQQKISRCRYPLHTLLTQFGEVFPKVEVHEKYLASVDIDYINLAYINFYTLKNVAKLDIEWVNTLNSHLQLDKRRRVLQIFRFPAFCRLMWTDGKDSFLQQLFEDHRKSQVNTNLYTEHTFSDYLREVMLSYRLLFGIDKHSRGAFKDELPAWRAGLPGGFSTQDQRDMHDPLLMLLCTTAPVHSSSSHRLSTLSSSLHELLWWLHGEEKSGLYDLEDFPFLGRRLANIQCFSFNQKPNDWKSLFWVDRRDPQSFWNGWIAWILLVIGSGTIVLQFFQLIFQVWGTFI